MLGDVVGFQLVSVDAGFNKPTEFVQSIGTVFDVNVVSHVKVGDRPVSLKLTSRSLPQLYGRPSKLHLAKLDVKLSSRAHLQLDITTHLLNMDRNNRRDDRGGRRDEPRNQKPRYGMRTH
jgi:hypothetical protein